jgi:tripartite-type tricarboxylate transporter receptor subunit TctC
MKKAIILLNVLLLATGSLFAAGTKEETGGTSADWPRKPIQVIIPYKAGGDTDIFGRIVAQSVQDTLGSTVVVVNVDGAGGTVATRQVRDAAPDGYTMLFMQPNMLLNRITGIIDFSYEAFDGIATSVSTKTTVLVTSADSKYKTLADLISAMKSNPGSVRFATQVGGYTHLTGLAIENAAGAKFKKLDVGGNTDQVAALLGGHVDLITMEYGIGQSYIDSGKVRVLANLATTRSSVIPDIPTAKEQGLDLGLGFEKAFFTCFPKGTPVEVMNIFNSALKKGIASGKSAADLAKLYGTSEFRDGSEAVKFLDDQMNYYRSFENLLKSDKF